MPKDGQNGEGLLPATSNPPPPAANETGVAAAEQAIAAKDVPKAIEILNEYVARDDIADRERAAELLQQSELAISNDYALSVHKSWLDKLSDADVMAAARGEQRVQVAIPLSHPNLQEVFHDTLGRTLGEAIRRRLEKKPDNTVQPDPLPNTEQPAPEPAPIKEEEEIVSEEEPADPADLLATRGLVQENRRWVLIEEATLREQLTKMRATLKRYKNSQEKITPAQRARLRAMQAKLAADEEKLRDQQQAVQGQVIPVEQFQAIQRLEEQVKQFKEQVFAVEGIVNNADEQVRTSRDELTSLVAESKDLLAETEEKYANLADDEKVTAALKQLGGSLGPTPLLKRVRLQIATTEKQIKVL